MKAALAEIPLDSSAPDSQTEQAITLAARQLLCRPLCDWHVRF